MSTCPPQAPDRALAFSALGLGRYLRTLRSRIFPRPRAPRCSLRGVSHPHSVYTVNSTSPKFYRTRIGTTGTSGKPPTCCNLWRPTPRLARPDASFPRRSSIVFFLRFCKQAPGVPPAPPEPVSGASVIGRWRHLRRVQARQRS
ncbi:hypothetical protein K523DRAFT_326424 [Schizophyllum commune Tattone D]|nr:hypothetical protein K523DRAFT_326424 [Schizophyllum commune Tattone D]